MNCFIYCRKSTEDQSRQVQSIGDQKRVLQEIADQRELNVVEIFTDEKSAGKPYQRPAFQTMMQRVQSGDASIMLTWKIDRLSRNPIENGQISWMLQQGIIKEIVTPDRVYLPDDNVLLYMVEGAMANQYLRDLKANVKRGMKSKVDKGLYPGYAPVGYLNEGKHKGSKYIAQDPEYFPKLQALWNLAKTGKYQLAELYRIMGNKYLLDKNGQVVTFSTFHRIFHNPFYCGVFKWNGQYHLGAHEPMLTQSEFALVQSFLDKNIKTRERKLEFDYKGAFTCGTCGATITAERKQKLVKSQDKHKSFDYYRCAHRRRHITCREKPLSKEKVERYLHSEIKKIYLPEVVLQHGIKCLKENESVQTEEYKEQLRQMERKIQGLQKTQNTVENNLVMEADPEIREIMKTKYNELKIQVRQQEEDKKELSEREKKRNEDICHQLAILQHANTILLTGDREQKLELLESLGSNWTLKDKSLHYEPNFVCEAIVKLQKTIPEKIRELELKKSSSTSEQTGDFETISFVWSSLWELIRNFLY